MASKKSRGLGDTVEKITEATGIQWLIVKITSILGLPCGCDYRRDLLNKWFPYGKKRKKR